MMNGLVFHKLVCGADTVLWYTDGVDNTRRTQTFGSYCQDEHVGSKSLLEQNPPVLSELSVPANSVACIMTIMVVCIS